MNEKALNYKNFGLEVMVRRKRRGVTQEELALATGLSRNMISLVERGGVGVSVETLVKIAQALKVTPGELLNELVKEE